MSRRRRRLVSRVVIVILLGHAAAVWAHAEAWPFSRYTLYTRTENWGDYMTLRLYGLTAAGAEFPVDHRYFPPMDSGRYSRALKKTFAWDDAKKPRKSELRKWAALYEANRRAGRHDGPALAVLRLYKVGWRMLPDAANRHAPPDGRHLRGEVVVLGETFGEGGLR